MSQEPVERLQALHIRGVRPLTMAALALAASRAGKTREDFVRELLEDYTLPIEKAMQQALPPQQESEE